MVLGIILGILFIALAAWICIKYFVLLGTVRIASDAFNKVHLQINKRYKLILENLDNCKENNDLVSETKELITKALDFNKQTDGTDRIIRFANAIFDNAEKLSITTEDSDFTAAKKYYNDCAQQLRHCTDVFPTSFMARLSEIRFIDSLK